MVYRILYVEANEDGTVGGSHKVMADLVARLSSTYQPVVLFYQDNLWTDRLRREGIEVVVWEEARRQELDARAQASQAGPLGRLGSMCREVLLRRRILRELKVDLVHLNNSHMVGNADWLPAARIAGIPCVTYAHGDGYRAPSMIRRFLIRRFDSIFPVSGLVEKGVAANGVPSSRIVRTYPGVDVAAAQTRKYRPPEKVLADLGVDVDDVFAVMVGNIRQWKGQHVVIEAVAALPLPERDKLALLIIGDTDSDSVEYVEGLKASIAAEGLQRTVRFTGRRNDIPDVLAAAEIAVHASVRPEPFGLVVQEAMLHGCAVVAADMGGPAEMLTPESGLTFDSKFPEQLTEHLRRLIDDPQLRTRLATEARRRVERLGVDRHVELIEGRYADLLR